MAATLTQFIAALESEEGYREGAHNTTKFAREANQPNGYAWCLTFLVAISKRVDLKLPDGVTSTAYTPTAALKFQAAKAWFKQNPQVGDWVFYDFPDTKRRIQHVGVIVKVNADGTFETIEGNTPNNGVSKLTQDDGDGVFRRHRDMKYVVGFGRPTFEPEKKAKPEPVVYVLKSTPSSPEAIFLGAYPELFGRRKVVAVPKRTVKGNADDIGFGVTVEGATKNYVGKDRYETLALALVGEGKR